MQYRDSKISLVFLIIAFEVAAINFFCCNENLTIDSKHIKI